MKEKNLHSLVEICLECGTQCALHSYTTVFSSALPSIQKSIQDKKKKQLDLIKRNETLRLKQFNKKKQLVNNIVYDKIKCHYCNEIKLRLTVKSRDYIDETGRDWVGKKCPSCRSIEYQKRKENRFKNKNCNYCNSNFTGLYSKKYCNVGCRRSNENIKRTIRKCITCQTLLGNTTRLKCSACYVPKKTYPSKSKPPKAAYNQTCVKCGVVFLVARKKKYCSQKCNKKANTNPALHKMYKKLRKRAVKKAKPKWCKWKEIVEVYVNCPEGMEVDHIHPLNHPDVCGLHVPWNLQYLSKEDNNKKSNSFDGTYENLGWKKKS